MPKQLKKLHRLYNLPDKIPVSIAPFSLKSSDIYELIMHLYLHYTGRYRVYRIMKPWQLEVMFGVFHTTIIEAAYDIDKGELKNQKEETVFNNFKCYAIEDLVSKHVRWYFQAGVGHRVSPIDGNTDDPCLDAHFPVYCYSDDITGSGVYVRTESDNSITPAFDFVLDFCLYRVATDKDFSSLIRIPGKTPYRKLQLKYYYIRKESYLGNAEDNLP